MVEITFNTNAWLGLRKAQDYGKGEYKAQWSPAFLFYDGEQPDEEQLEEMRREWHEQERKKWEKAQPLGGKPQDVYCFELMLSTGNIHGDVTGEQRREQLCTLCGINMADDHQSERHFSDARNFLEKASERIAGGEPVRIWYSEYADDYCGLLWFTSELCKRKLPFDKVFLVKVPVWDETFSGKKFFSCGTAEADETVFQKCAENQQQLTPKHIEFLAQKWQSMRNENTVLRVVLGGHPISVPEDFYDTLIWRTIETFEEEFSVGHLVGTMYIQDMRLPYFWIKYRLAAFADEGRLAITGPDPRFQDDYIYKRKD